MSSKLMLIASNCDGEVKMLGRGCYGKRRLCVYMVPLQRTSSSQAHLVILNEVIKVMGKYTHGTVGEKNRSTDTSLHLAPYKENIDLDAFNALLQVNPRVMRVKNKYGDNPTHIAISNEEVRLDVIKAII